MRYLFLCLLLISCSKTITILEDGKPKDLTFKSSEIISETKKVDSLGKEFIDTIRTSCTYPGVCANCGLKFNGSFECGVGFYVSCPGTMNQTIEFTPYMFHIEYTIKPEEKFSKEIQLVSPSLSSLYKKVLKQTACR